MREFTIRLNYNKRQVVYLNLEVMPPTGQGARANTLSPIHTEFH